MAVYCYARVSTGRQAESGLSLEEQQRQVVAYCEAHRLGSVESFFIERGVSGALELTKRLEGSRLLSELRSGDVVVCSKLDRMFRSARDALNTVKEFEAKRISLHFIDLGGDVSTNGVAKLFFTIMGAVAEFERNRISERQRDAKAQAMSEGRYTGGKRKFGYRIEVIDGRKRLVADWREQTVLNFVIANGHLKLKEIQDCISSKFETELSMASISRLLANSASS